MKKSRNYYVDMVRGLMIISMVIYHILYDLVYFFNYKIEFLHGRVAEVWQVSTVIIFLIVSGISLRFYKNYKKRGAYIFVLGFVITIATYLFDSDDYVLFGILSLIGASIFIIGLIEKGLLKINEYLGILIFLLLFVVFYNLPSGYLNLGFTKINVPEFLYSLKYTFIVGLPHAGFSSVDYFPIVPWFFIFVVGFYMGIVAEEKGYLSPMGKPNILSYIGEKSLIIYLLHQVVIYAVLFIVSKFIT